MFILTKMKIIELDQSKWLVGPLSMNVGPGKFRTTEFWENIKYYEIGSTKNITQSGRLYID